MSPEHHLAPPSAERFLIDSPAHHRWLAAESVRLLDFGRGAALCNGEFGWLDSQGTVTPSTPAPLYVTCRMTHAYSLGSLLGVQGCETLVDHGLAALAHRFRDAENGGWFTAILGPGVTDDRKMAYPHAFVILAASSASIAGRPGADNLLAEALEICEAHFWDETAGMVVEGWDRTFHTLDTYRGLNSAMHTVEAFLAAFAATSDDRWLGRATRITRRAIGFSRAQEWRLPEHFDSEWRPLLEYNCETPDDPFRPYGSTVGHWLEWSRLALHLRAALQESGDTVTGDALLQDAVDLFDAAVRAGWYVDGAPGFVYTVDWSGAPRVRQRLHWVLCEAIGAATTLWKATGEAAYRDWYATWWAYADEFLIDRVQGSWHHELDVDNRPAQSIRPGKADIYHALQATLLPRLGLGAALASELRDHAPNI